MSREGGNGTGLGKGTEGTLAFSEASMVKRVHLFRLASGHRVFVIFSVVSDLQTFRPK